MRKKLKELGSDKRHKFYAQFVRFGVKIGYKGPIATVLLKNVCDEYGDLITDHLWFNKTKGFTNLNLVEDDIISFDARVDAYEKGYKGYDCMKQLDNPIEMDYKLSYPTHIQRVSNDELQKESEMSK